MSRNDAVIDLMNEAHKLREALKELLDALGALNGGGHELEGYCISPKRCKEMRDLAIGAEK